MFRTIFRIILNFVDIRTSQVKSLFFFTFLLSSTYSQNGESWKIYDDSQLAVIEITMAPSALDYMYQNFNSDLMHASTVHFKNAYIDETIDSVGIGIRGNTSRSAAKKSIKLSFNEFIKGRQFYDLDKMNLNGEHNDPSIIRSKLVWDLYEAIGMKSTRAAHTKVYINGKYYGLYISVEHIDDKFVEKNFADDSGNLWKCLYPADLVYKGKDPNLYKKVENERRSYDLTTNKQQDDYSILARLIDIINNTPSSSFADSLEKVLAVPEVLKYFAIDILTGCWDDYWFLKNNYYLYHEPAKDLFHWIPYDADNSFGVDWFSIDWTSVDPYTYRNIDNTERPLAEKIMMNDQYRNLYSHFLQFYLNNVYKLALLEPEISRLQSLITPAVLSDTYYKLDYGFTMTDFSNSYSSSGYSNLHVKRGIREFINIRSSTLRTQLNWKDAAPNIYQLDWFPKSPTINDTVYVTVSAFSNNGIKDLSIVFLPDYLDPIIKIPLEFKPIAGTKKVEEADRWIGVIPPQQNSGAFYISAEDNTNKISNYPRANQIRLNYITKAVRINEIAARNDNFIADQNGEYDDWIELYNSSTDTITLSGLYVTDARKNLTKWKIPGDDVTLAPGAFTLLWCDEDTTQTGLHTNFKLDADGEFIALVDSDGTTILDSLKFPAMKENNTYGRIPDGSSLFHYTSPTPLSGNTVTEVDKDSPIYNFNISAYPNPFNPSTIIQYEISERTNVTITIYDMLGREIFSKKEGAINPGKYSFKWNSNTSLSGNISSGIYICRIEAGRLNNHIKLMQIK